MTVDDINIHIIIYSVLYSIMHIVRICPDCRGSNFVVTREADVVCRGCGLVCEERIFDDTPEWRCFDGDEGNIRAEVICDKLSSDMIWLKNRLEFLDDILDDTLKANITDSWKKTYHVRLHKETLLASIIYHISASLHRGFPANQCISMVPECNPKKFWDFYQNLMLPQYKELSCKNLAECKRIAYALSLKNPSLTIKSLRHVLDIVHHKGLQGSAKSSNFNICVVFKACLMAGEDVHAKDMIKQFGVTAKTFQRYICVLNEHI